MDAGAPAALRSGFVLLWGAPGTGKSALLNALVGESISLSSPKPRTTRNRIVGVKEEPGYQMVFLDVPGVFEARNRLEKHLARTASREIESADVILFLVDAGARGPAVEDRLAARWLGSPDVPVLLVANKIDGAPRTKPILDARLAEFGRLRGFAATVSVSATQGTGLDRLLSEVRSRLPEGPAYYPEGTVTDLPEKLEISELIREQCLRFLHQDLPYACAVLVHSVGEAGPGIARVAATIHVEDESEKGILIGKGGEMIKRIGQGAREGIEASFGRKIFLDLKVAVAPGWRDDPEALKRFGFDAE